MARLAVFVCLAAAFAAVVAPVSGVGLPHAPALRSVLAKTGPDEMVLSHRFLQARQDPVTNPEEANEKEVEAAAGGGDAASAAGQVTGGGAADTSVAAKGGDDGVDSAKEAALAKTQEERRAAREEKAKAELAGGDAGTDALASVGTSESDGGVSQEAKADAAAEDITGVADSSSDQAAALSQENQGASLTSNAVGAVNAGSSAGGGAEAGGDASASTGASSSDSLVTVSDQDSAFL
ncbi:hypothetical protein FNF29_07915 [Cafeteria roenbergensis]|uniref:RxLR effector protein n=1 Tax=Cafeteria roenbergensis TaxID=33653 RepID=A0A5A8C0X3_CAFRO|nr:hypothetical protein FNF29_07915 [Cafeteria roenbergensis]|eukprot:KAA0146673.1 hypothetical protein FNF29_07915 [Cafeteria roenbergensis]